MSDHPNAAFFTAIQACETPAGKGIPGIAKTETIKAFAIAARRRAYVLIGSIREPADIGGYPYPVDSVLASQPVENSQGKAIGHIALVAPKWAADTWDGDKHLIVFDELTTCPPAQQAAMLRVIAENVVGDLELPHDVWKCALYNPPGLAANGFELEPPMANRLCHLDWEVDWDSWDQGISAGLQFPDPQFPHVPDDWTDRLSQVGSLIAAFRRHKSDCFHPPMDSDGGIKLERSKLSGAWPSPRSWTIAMKCRAAAQAAGCSKLTVSRLLHGCVGFEAAHQFETWEANLDLPDAEEQIQIAAQCLELEKPYEAPKLERADRIIAFIAMITERIVGKKDDEKRYNLERWNAGMSIVEHMAETNLDIVLSQCKTLVGNRPENAMISKSFASKYAKVLNEIHHAR